MSAVTHMSVADLVEFERQVGVGVERQRVLGLIDQALAGLHQAGKESFLRGGSTAATQAKIALVESLRDMIMRGDQPRAKAASKPPL